MAPQAITARRKLTLAVVNSLPPNTTAWDADLKGFCARRQSGPTISYQVKTRVRGRIRWFTIGRHGQPWTPETARRQALKILADPTTTATEQDDARPTAHLFAEIIEHFFTQHGPKLKPRSLQEYRSLARLYLIPAFGKVRIDALTRGEISRAHASWHEHPRAANHALAVLSKVLSWAEDQGYRPDHSNPCGKIQRYDEQHRERYLTHEEIARLGSVLDRAEANGIASGSAVAAIRLLLLTGARLSEILTLEWRFIDRERQIAFLPDSKTGRKPLTLNDAAFAVLDTLPRFASNPYVIPGTKSGAHLVNLQKPWRAIRTLAGLDDVRIHDLRHTWASHAIAAGGSLAIIGRQLGHAQPQTTQRYAHLADDPVRQLSQSTGSTLATALATNTRKAT